MPLLSEMLKQNLERLDGLAEGDCRTSCPTCGEEQRLDQATVDQTDPLETIYTCRNDDGTILIVTTPGVIPWEGRGYRIKDWSVRNPRDLFFRPPGAEVEVLIPSSPEALF